jgi:2-octaprenyl-6-methoxyphenol hydroxylase
MTDTNFDIAIVGGGLVGASLVLALNQFAEGMNLRVLQIEANAPALSSAVHEERHLALNAFSWQSLQQLGVALDAKRCAAIARVHVSSRGDFGRILLDAKAEGLAEFGRLVPASHLRDALEAGIANCAPGWLTRLSGVRLEGMHANESRRSGDTANESRRSGDTANESRRSGDTEKESVELRLAGASAPINARLVVGCDGTHSSVRASMSGATPVDDGIFDYQASAISFNFKPEYDAANTAYERFTDTGPIALLPLPNRRMGAIWTLPTTAASAALALSDVAFLSQFQAAFGYRLGRFSALSKRALWPLMRMRAQPDFAERCVLIGNAAQTIHPLGAQGFNLGLRDALALAKVIQTGNFVADALIAFSQARAKDRGDTLRFSDSGLVATQNTTPFARAFRSAAFTALEIAPLAKRSLARFGLGFVR